MLGNADVRISYVAAGEAQPALPQRHRRRVRLRRVRAPRPSRRCFGALPVAPGRLRDPAPRHHPPLAARRATTRCARYVIEANSHIAPPDAVPVALRAAPRARARTASATCTARPSRCSSTSTDVEVLRQAPRPRRAASPAPATSSRPTRSTSSAGTAACTRTRSTSPTSSRSPAGCTSPRPCTRCSRATTSSICNFVPRKVDYHPLAVPVPYYHANVDSDEVMFYCDGDYEARKGSGIGAGLDQPAPRRPRHGPQPGAVERSLGAESFDELAVMVDTFRPLELGEAARACEDPDVRVDAGQDGGRSVTGARSDRGGDCPGRPAVRRRQPPLRRVLHRRHTTRAIGVRVGDAVVDLAAALGTDGPDAAFAAPALNPFMARRAAPAGPRSAGAITALVTDDVPDAAVHPVDDVVAAPAVRGRRLRRLLRLGAPRANLGRLFRPDSEPLTPNWKHMPVGYHGRAGTVVVSGTDVVRPSGQRKEPADAVPTFGPSTRLDIEAELGFVVGVGTPLGAPIPVDAFAEHVFGAVPGQRLVRPRPAGLGVRAAGTAPGQVLRHVRVALGGAAARAGGRAGPPARPGRPAAAALPARRAHHGDSTSTSPSSGTARWSAARRTGRCTGHRHRCWRT